MNCRSTLSCISLFEYFLSSLPLNKVFIPRINTNATDISKITATIFTKISETII